MNVQENADYFRYLYQLQRSGKTNMFGAGSYLVANFGLGNNEARAVLSHWMTNYESIAKELGIEI